MDKDTIVAIATPFGHGGIGIVRLSGPRALDIGDAIFRARRPGKISDQPAYSARYGTVMAADSGRTIDEAIALVMRSPASYTTEDVLELQCHGGPVALSAVLKEALGQGARLAEPGEFTLRAFLNGRLDLAQAEAVNDVITAATEAGLDLAERQLSGSLSQEIRELTGQLMEIEAQLEAGIDFPEDIIEELEPVELGRRLAGLGARLKVLVRQGETGHLVKEGLAAVILGKPNVGKSSLLNALVGSERALVTDIAGTTRDVIDEVIDVFGLPVRLLDTAGIRQSEDPIEQLGVEMAKGRLKTAQLVLMVMDAVSGLDEEDRLIYALCEDKKMLLLVNKIDAGHQLTADQLRSLYPERLVLPVSVKDGRGLEELKRAIYETVLGDKIHIEHVAVSNLRHIAALTAAQEDLAEAELAIDSGFGYDIVSSAIRSARFELGKITGESVDGDIVDRIFQDFCVGK